MYTCRCWYFLFTCRTWLLIWICSYVWLLNWWRYLNAVSNNVDVAGTTAYIYGMPNGQVAWNLPLLFLSFMLLKMRMMKKMNNERMKQMMMMMMMVMMMVMITMMMMMMLLLLLLLNPFGNERSTWKAAFAFAGPWWLGVLAQQPAKKGRACCCGWSSPIFVVANKNLGYQKSDVETTYIQYV